MNFFAMIWVKLEPDFLFHPQHLHEHLAMSPHKANRADLKCKEVKVHAFCVYLPHGLAMTLATCPFAFIPCLVRTLNRTDTATGQKV